MAEDLPVIHETIKLLNDDDVLKLFKGTLILDSSHQSCDRRFPITNEDHASVTQLLQKNANTPDSIWNRTFSRHHQTKTVRGVLITQSKRECRALSSSSVRQTE